MPKHTGCKHIDDLQESMEITEIHTKKFNKILDNLLRFVSLVVLINVLIFLVVIYCKIDKIEIPSDDCYLSIHNFVSVKKYSKTNKTVNVESFIHRFSKPFVLQIIKNAENDCLCCPSPPPPLPPIAMN